MSVVWLNGALLPADQARIDPADRGFLLADGLFETMRVGEGRVWHVRQHLARLRWGAGLLGLPLPCDDNAINAAILQTTAANGLPAAAVRLTLTAGVGPRGLARPAEPQPTLMITAAKPKPALGPASLIVAQSTRRNEHSPMCRIKALGYGDQILARREAAARNADDAIMMNTAGHLVGASAASLLLHNGAEWLTPPVESGALPGIARGLLIGARLVRESVLLPDELMRASQLLLVNALGPRAVARAEDRAFGPRPELTASLLPALRDTDITRGPF